MGRDAIHTTAPKEIRMRIGIRPGIPKELQRITDDKLDA